MIVSNGTASFADRNVGTSKLITFRDFSLTGKDAQNYTIAEQQTGISANISAKPIEIINIVAVDRPYNNTQIVSLTEGKLVGVEQGDSVGFILGHGLITSTHIGVDRPVATNIALTGPDMGNYILIQPEDVTVTITLIPLQTSVGDIKKSGTKKILAKNVVSDKAEIILEGVTRVVVYDAAGNAVFNSEFGMRNSESIIWDLRNNAGRHVANGTYLVVVETGSGIYSAKVGVKK